MIARVEDWVMHFAPGPSWASRLLHACRSGRIDPETMWSILLAHADAVNEPDVAALLEHVRHPAERTPERPKPPTSDDLVVIEDPAEEP
jgi:hypothetical protein